MKGKPINENVTLKKLLSIKIKERNLSRSKLVLRMGYANVSKALRRLDHYLSSLEMPSEEFVVRLLSTLEIDDQDFQRAVSATLNDIRNDTERNFHPFIRALLGIQIRPAIAWQLIHNQCRFSVSRELQDNAYQEEIKTVISLYQDHVDNVLSENLKKHVIGFEYHRKYNYFLRFNSDLEFEKTVSVQPVPKGKIPLASRLANILSVSCIG